MQDTHSTGRRAIPQSWSSLIGGGQAWASGRHPRNLEIIFRRWPDELLHNARWAKRAELTQCPPVFRGGMGCLKRRELWNSFPFWQTAVVIDRHLVVSCGKSLQQLCSMQIVVAHMPKPQMGKLSTICLFGHCDGVCWWKWVCRVYNIYIGNITA